MTLMVYPRTITLSWSNSRFGWVARVGWMAGFRVEPTAGWPECENGDWPLVAEKGKLARADFDPILPFASPRFQRQQSMCSSHTDRAPTYSISARTSIRPAGRVGLHFNAYRPLSFDGTQIQFLDRL